MAKRNSENQATNTTEIIARTKNPGHPTGGMNRAGLRITTTAQAFQVTDEQLQVLVNDPSIVVEGDAKRIRQLKENHGVQEAETNETMNGKEEIDGDVNTVEEEESENTDQTGETDQVLIKNMNKAELIKALEEKGLKKGKDFEETATNKDLRELLSVS